MTMNNQAMTGARRPGPRGSGASSVALAGLSLALVLGLFSTRGLQADKGTAEEIGGARDLLEEWVELRRTISAERRDWLLGREVLGDRIELTKDQIASVRDQIEKAREDITETDLDLAKEVQTNEDLKEDSKVLKEIVVGLEARTLELVARVPQASLENIELLLTRIPTTPEGAEDQSLSDRFLNVVGVLNELGRFNREISVTSERRDLADGTTKEVAVVYVGLGQAYYVSGETAGYGTVGPEGWTWTQDDTAAEAIAQAVGILTDGDLAEYVRLPLKVVDHTGLEAAPETTDEAHQDSADTEQPEAASAELQDETTGTGEAGEAGEAGESAWEEQP